LINKISIQAHKKIDIDYVTNKILID